MSVRYLTCLILMLGSLQAAAMSDEALRFKVFLNERFLGHHNFLVSETMAGHQVASEASFEFKLMFITAFRYQHSVREQWQGDCLSAVESTTQENRNRYAVEAIRAGADLNVRSRVNDTAFAGMLSGCIGSFAYWNPRIVLGARQLLNVQTGEYVDVRSDYLGEEQITAGGKAITARKFRLQARDLNIDLWYSASNEWLGLESTESGRTLRYERI